MVNVAQELKEYREPASEAEWMALAAFYSRVFPFSGGTEMLKLRSASAHPWHNTFFLTAFEEKRILGACAFIPYLFHAENRDLCAWQLAWAGVLPEARRQGIFAEIESRGRERIFANGGDFLFSFPDPGKTSGPVFSGSLNYQPLALTKTLVLSYSRYFQLQTIAPHLPEPITEPDYFVMLERCKKIAGKNFLSLEWKGNRLFGYRKNETFLCGDIRLISGEGLEGLVRQVFAHQGIHLFRFTASPQHPAWRGIRFPKMEHAPVRIRVNPSVWDLDMQKIQICAALKDTFGWA